MMDPQQPSLHMPGGLPPEDIQRLIVEATLAYRQADPNSNPDGQSQYEVAAQFLQAAQDHLKSNPRLASVMAQKAHTLFGALAPKPHPTDTGLVGLLKPFLGKPRSD